MRAMILLLLCSAVTCLTGAQEPVPIGQAAPTVRIEGVVRTPQGELLGNIAVTVRSDTGEKNFTTETNSEGSFAVGVPPGQYTITAAAKGFAETSRKIAVLPNQAASLVLIVGGPVPNGEAGKSGNASGPVTKPAVAAGLLDVPIPSVGSVATEGQFSNWTDLAGWLNGQSARNLRLQAILTTGSYHNLFVWISRAGTDQHIVVQATQIHNAVDLQSILKAYAQATVIGFAWVGHDRYLVLRSNP